MKKLIAGLVAAGVILSIAFINMCPQDQLVQGYNFHHDRMLHAELYEQRTYHWKRVVRIEKEMTPEQLAKRNQTKTEHYIDVLKTAITKSIDGNTRLVNRVLGK